MPPQKPAAYALPGATPAPVVPFPAKRTSGLLIGYPQRYPSQADSASVQMPLAFHSHGHVLMHHRRHRLYDTQQRERVWHEHAQLPASAVAVGVMGLGVLGRDAALALRSLGFRVAGWSRTPKTLPDIETFHGDAGLGAFLRRREILVCLLPATPATQGMLKLELIRKLKRDGAAGGAYLINAARGALQVDADILAALEEGLLAGATLDVFASEPLAAAS